MNEFSLVFSQVASAFILWLPKLLLAIFTLLFGGMVANNVRNGLKKIVRSDILGNLIESFYPEFKKTEEAAQFAARIIAYIGYYVVWYVVLLLLFSLLGMGSVLELLFSITSLFPKLFSAMVVFAIGLVIAGLLESLVKKALLPLGPATQRLGGKVSSYAVLAMFVLISLSELGIATLFVTTLFIGLVSALSLAFGLAIGLGAKDLVSEMLTSWYHNRNKK